MTTTPRLSVVMPSFNQAKYIRTAINSVLSQGEEGIELIVMDGGSTDHTVDILRRYDDRLHFVSERDRGQADAINRGFQRAGGDILCWLNSDDVLMPGSLRRVIRVLQENPQAEFVYGRGWNIDESGRILAEAGVLAFDLWRLIHQRNFIQQPSCFFRRSLLERAGPLDERLHYVMDWDLWIRFAAYRGLYVNDFWSSNRVYRDNKTQSGQLRRWREIKTMVRRYTDVRRPPVVRLYLLEALIQLVRSGRLPASLEDPLAREFQRGMQRHMSGRYPDGSVRPRFRVSVGNPHYHPAIALTMSPLSRYHRSRLGAEPVQVRWRSSGGGHGSFTLLENGAPQRFVIAPDLSASTFVHLTCWSDHPGMARHRGGRSPTHRVIGFLEEVEAEATPPGAPAMRSAPGADAALAIPAYESAATRIEDQALAVTGASPEAEADDGYGPEERPAEADGDRLIHLELIEALTDRLRRVEADRAARLEQIETLTDRLFEADRDRAARLEQIETLTAWLREGEADRAARLEQIETLTAWLREAEADRAARLEQIETLTVRVRGADLDGAELARLRAHVEAIHRSWAWRVYRFLGRRAGGGSGGSGEGNQAP
jgi:glycosyltransferase involved in cell wall biosynthesis